MGKYTTVNEIIIVDGLEYNVRIVIDLDNSITMGFLEYGCGIVSQGNSVGDVKDNLSNLVRSYIDIVGTEFLNAVSVHL